jgi:hypothetical protein
MAAGGAIERPLEPLLPGFVSTSAVMQRVVEQIPTDARGMT